MISDTLSDANWEIAGYMKDGFYRRTPDFIAKVAMVSGLMDELRSALDTGTDGMGGTPLIDEFIKTHDMNPLIDALEWHVKEAR